MKLDKERLRVLAEAATPGPWILLPVEDGSPYLRVRGTRLGARYKVANVLAPTYFMPRDGIESTANAEFIAAARDAVPTLLAENAALAAEVERLRGIIKVTTAIAITMLFDSCPEDVKRTFSIEELEKIVGISEPLQDQNAQVEDIYRSAWDAAMADKGGVSES